jgi:reactive intermediate/imine deaminase
MLDTAMRQVEQQLRASMITFDIEPPTTADARWCLEQYFSELERRFDGGFDRRLTISAHPRELSPPSGLLILARLRGRPVGCGALKFHKEQLAELKRMWIAESARGLGVGRRMLAELERHARNAGVKVLRLDTNRALNEAIRLYRRSGYIEVEAFNSEPYAHHWFEKRLSSPEERAMSKTAITSRELAPPVGPFSQAVEVGGFLYFSGQVAQDPATGKLVEGGIAAETERVLQNLSAVLTAAGKSFDDVVRAGVFLTRMSDFVAMNDIYARYFTRPFPARTTIGVAALPLGACVEMDLVVKA